MPTDTPETDALPAPADDADDAAARAHAPSAALLRGIGAALARPVLLEPRAVDAVRGASAFHARGGRAAAAAGEAPPFAREGEVAVVGIEGPLAQRAWACMGFFFGDGYDAVEARVRAALDDRGVRAVVLRIDSPGGEVAGCFECVRALRAAARDAGKPLVAYADELAASAAYALATAAEEIVAPDTGAVGSVGVITVLSERTKQNAMVGRTVRVVRSGALKAVPHPDEPMTDAGVARVQADIDALAAIFADEVAGARGLTRAQVLDLQADLFLGREGVARGLADRVGNLRDAITRARELAAHRTERKHMKTAAQALGLPADASDEAIVAAIESRDAAARDHARVLGALGARSADAALGAIDGLKASERELAELKAAQAEREAAERAAAERRAAQERADLIAQGTAEGQFAAHDLETWVPEASTDRLRAFLARAPRRARAAKDEHKEPGVTGATGPAAGSLTTPEGKTWEQLKPAEKRALRATNRALYDAMLADANARGVRG